MALDTIQQVIQQIERSARVLLVPHKDFDPDVFTSALALAVFLKQGKKQVDFYVPYELPEKFFFLPGTKSLEAPSRLSGDFIIRVNTQGRKIKELRYQSDGEALKIYLTPEGEPLAHEDISHERAGDQYDTVITVGCQDLESAGEVFERYPHLFFNKPVINIDRKLHNEEFAEINLVDVARGALAELTTDVIEKWRHDAMGEEIATILLTGIISGTNNFRSHSTTPHTLSQAAHLISQGADHQAIIQNLYKTKRLPLLKLLGRLMSNTEYLEEVRLSWSTLTSQDLYDTGNTARDLTHILDEFREQFPHPETIAISLTNGNPENPNSKTLIYSPREHLIALLHRELGGERKSNKLVVESGKEPTALLKERVIGLLGNAEEKRVWYNKR